MNNILPDGWTQYDDYKENEFFQHNDSEITLLSSDKKSTLVKENEVFLEFEGDTHFLDAISKHDEIVGIN